MSPARFDDERAVLEEQERLKNVRELEETGGDLARPVRILIGFPNLSR